jgi:hypothetical protein
MRPAPSLCLAHIAPAVRARRKEQPPPPSLARQRNSAATPGSHQRQDAAAVLRHSSQRVLARRGRGAKHQRDKAAVAAEGEVP